jgi:mRNA-degrading endonuclease RelE of RelBE toxin-antitoxin system
MHPSLKKKVESSLKLILSDRQLGKALMDEIEGSRSLRVSSFRIIYGIKDPEQIELVAMGPRSRIYEGTFRIIQKEGGKVKEGHIPVFREMGLINFGGISYEEKDFFGSHRRVYPVVSAGFHRPWGDLEVRLCIHSLALASYGRDEMGSDVRWRFHCRSGVFSHLRLPGG